MQLFILSARPSVLGLTVEAVRRYQTWIKEIVVVCPARLLTDTIAVTNDFGDVRVLTDEAMTGLTSTEIAAMSHVVRNVSIRHHTLAAAGVLDDVFIMSDDDYRPLKPIDERTFAGDDGHIGYYCYDLEAWTSDTTDFDRALHRTRELLRLLGAPRRHFGSHMPQIIRRDLMCSLLDEAVAIVGDRRVCEWTLYFNLGAHREPALFDTPRPFRTLGWPAWPGDWPLHVRPSDIAYENVDPGAYAPGGLFHGLSELTPAGEPAEALAVAHQKLMRWSDREMAVRRLEHSGPVWDPNSRPGLSTRARFKLLRRLKQALDTVSFDQRSRSGS